MNSNRNKHLSLFRSLSLLLILFLVPGPGLSKGRTRTSRQEPAPADIRTKIDSLIRLRHIGKNGLGIKVVSLQDGSTLYSLNNEKNFAPASTMKILTMAVALEKLGANYRWKTELWADGPITEGTLNGNLYVKGYGSPYFLESDMQALAQMARNAGIGRIRGQLYFDDSYFDGVRNGPGVLPESTSYYDPIISALSYSFNFLSVIVSPGSRLGSPVLVELSPTSSQIQVSNRARTAKARSMVSVAYRKSTDTLAISGNLSLSSPSVYRTYKVFSPENFFACAFSDHLQKEGVKVSSQRPEAREVEPERSGFHRVAVHYSTPLMEVMRIIGKNSNNFIADQLFKTLGAEILGAPGSFEKGAQALGRYLGELGFKPGTFQIKDGSGLSHENQLSADILMAVLQRMYFSDQLRPIFVDSLAWAGMDGTLGERLTSTETQGRIFAKTGTLSGVSCLSGYVAAPRRGDLAFSIFINETLGRIRAKRMEDAIVSVLADE